MLIWKSRRVRYSGYLDQTAPGKQLSSRYYARWVLHDEGKVLVNGIDVKRHPGQVLNNLQAVLRNFEALLVGCRADKILISTLLSTV